jgi:hypothetical protein
VARHRIHPDPRRTPYIKGIEYFPGVHIYDLARPLEYCILRTTVQEIATHRGNGKLVYFGKKLLHPIEVLGAQNCLFIEGRRI